MAVELRARIRHDFQIDVPTLALLQEHSIASLTAQVLQDLSERSAAQAA
jgi:hypothetical protein